VGDGRYSALDQDDDILIDGVVYAVDVGMWWCGVCCSVEGSDVACCYEPCLFRLCGGCCRVHFGEVSILVFFFVSMGSDLACVLIVYAVRRLVLVLCILVCVRVSCDMVASVHPDSEICSRY